MNALIAPPFPTNPAVGQRFGNWVWNGVMWVSSPTTGIQVLTSVFTASGPYMPSPGLVTVKVFCIGGGGGGGAAQGASSTGVWAGGGGGSGGYSTKTLPASLVLGGVAVTIGAGGAGNVWSGTSTTAGNGGATSFGALCLANGGLCGTGAGNGGGGEPGNGGAPGVGDLAWRGASGSGGVIQVLTETLEYEAIGGIGGVVFGGNQAASAGTGAEAAGINGDPGSGAGGGGGVINQSGAITSGGGGGSGICWVDEYCWADVSGGDCVNPPLNVNARVAVTHVPWQGPGPCPPGWGDYEGDG